MAVSTIQWTWGFLSLFVSFLCLWIASSSGERRVWILPAYGFFGIGCYVAGKIKGEASV